MTPFEIRLELLKMARDMLYDSYHAERDRLQQDWNIKCDTARSKGETPPEHPTLPTIPSEQETTWLYSSKRFQWKLCC